MWRKDRDKSTNTYNPDPLIRQVEHRWLPPLDQFVEAVFSKTRLPSHDHTHHRRVWSYAKDLVRTLHREGYRFSEAKLEQLMIAVFFHDTGLTRTPDASHGKESREICRKFLESRPSLPAGSLNAILEAVEKHDDKSYAEMSAGKKRPPDDILTMLAVCDDLDAFGATGVFRYLEIYIQRGIPLPSVPARVMENLERRVGYLLQNYGDLKDFVQVHQERYQFTVDFYRELDLQYNSASGIPAGMGPVKVIDLLVGKVLHEKIHPGEIASLMENPALDEYSLRYFRQLENELK
jgi:HD superfamily phosphodiesterase